MARPWPIRSLGALVAALLLAAAPAALAANRLVTDCGDSGLPGQLRALITQAQPGDTILVPRCTITLTGAAAEDANLSGDLDVVSGKTLTLQGVGQDASTLDGGAVDRVLHVLAGATVVLRDLTLRNGKAPNGSGGGGIRNAGTLTLVDSTVTRNTTGTGFGEAGGGIFNASAGTLTLTNVTVSNNTAEDGGGLLNAGGAVTISASRIIGNAAVGFGVGGGLYNESGSMTVTDTTIAANTSGGSGGGVRHFSVDPMIITRSTISGNRAGGSGGGLRILRTATIVNSTIVHNLTESRGGGISFGASTDTLTIVNSTIVGNADASPADPERAGGVAKTGGVLLVRNSVISRNVSPSTATLDDVDPADLDQNLANFIGGDPRLGPLQDNGGPTLTMAPLPGSPLIDAGSNALATAAGLTTDQRGRPRVVDGNANGIATVDMGAVEVQIPAPAASALIVLPTSTFPLGSTVDFLLVLSAPGRAITGGLALFDGANVSSPLGACVVPGVLATGDRTFACNGVAASLLGLGTHTLTVTLTLDDGSTVSDSATLQVVP